VFSTCAGVAKQAWPQVVVFYCIYAPDILIVFPRKISLTPGETVFRYPGGDHLGRETAATAHSGLNADTFNAGEVPIPREKLALLLPEKRYPE
jgi:hypothetical protein